MAEHRHETVQLLSVLLDATLRSMAVARSCREDPLLFALLVRKKDQREANERFAADYKTVADALIQDMVRSLVMAVFPAMGPQTHGEESPDFPSYACSDTVVQVKMGEDAAATAAMLETIMGAEHAPAAEALAALVHRPMAHAAARCGLVGSALLELAGETFDPAKTGIWIDPIDGTNELIAGDQPPRDPVTCLFSRGLQVVTVLVGVYDRVSGLPWLGVVGQPFAEPGDVCGGAGGELSGRVVWGVVTRGGGEGVVRGRGNGQPPASDRAAAAGQIVAVLSSAEPATVRDGLSSNLGAHLVPVAGAGYKVLAVIDGLADAYVLSKGSTYKWDTCAPHAILRALGGGLFPFWMDPARSHATAQEVTYHQPDHMEHRGTKKEWANQAGLIATGGPGARVRAADVRRAVAGVGAAAASTQP